MISELKPGERLDDLERNGLMLIQHPGRFCYGVDAVLLSWFAKASEGERVLDFCTGTGVVPILMTAKTAASHFTGLEIQEEVAKMASRSVMLNHLGDKVSIICGDLKNTKTLFGKGVFNVVTVNPPYMAGGSGLVGADYSNAGNIFAIQHQTNQIFSLIIFIVFMIACHWRMNIKMIQKLLTISCILCCNKIYFL